VSSTKRGSVREASDYYVTPIEAVRTFLKTFADAEPHYFKNLIETGKVLDPCAGGDPQSVMSYPAALMDAGLRAEHITTVDIRPDSRAQIKQDYLDCAFQDGQFDLVISNPPFVLAQEFIQKALTEVKPFGYVVMLLRLNYFGSLKRIPFWTENMAKYAFVHAARMSFNTPLSMELEGRTKKGTDSIEYMHCCWQRGYKTQHTMLRIIEG
jgi:hypothetical protein